MIRIWPFRRRITASDAARTLSMVGHQQYRQAVRARALEMARRHGVASAVEVLER